MSLAFWQNKRATGPSSWADYWDTLGAPHRDALIDALRTIPAFESLLEVGCGPGVNMFRILQAFPDVDVTGLDVSASAIDYANTRFHQAMGNGELPGSGRAALCVGELPGALEVMGQVDVVLSCYTLAYVHPLDIKHTIERLLTLARSAVVIAEPMVMPACPPGLIPHFGAGSRPREFRYDYLRWFNDVEKGSWKVTTLKPLHVDRMNRLLVAERIQGYVDGK